VRATSDEILQDFSEAWLREASASERIKSFCIVLPVQKLGWTERGGEHPSDGDPMEFSIEGLDIEVRIADQIEWSWGRLDRQHGGRPG